MIKLNLASSKFEKVITPSFLSLPKGRVTITFASSSFVDYLVCVNCPQVDGFLLADRSSPELGFNFLQLKLQLNSLLSQFGCQDKDIVLMVDDNLMFGAGTSVLAADVYELCTRGTVTPHMLLLRRILDMTKYCALSASEQYSFVKCKPWCLSTAGEETAQGSVPGVGESGGDVMHPFVSLLLKQQMVDRRRADVLNIAMSAVKSQRIGMWEREYCKYINMCCGTHLSVSSSSDSLTDFAPGHHKPRHSNSGHNAGALSEWAKTGNCQWVLSGAGV